MHHLTNITKTVDSAHSTITLSAELPAELLMAHRAKALASLAKEVHIDGFRKGHVPEHVALARIGEGTLLQEAADRAISEELPLLLATEDVRAITTPKVTVTKLAPGNPLAFTAQVEVLPDIELPDYASIAKKEVGKKEVAPVTDADVSEVLTRLRRERMRIDSIEKGTEAEEAQKAAEEAAVDALPQLDDEFVKSVGYESVEVFTAKIRENIAADREASAQEKVRTAIVEAILEKTPVAVPHSLIDYEIHKMEGQFADDLARAGLSFDDYLKKAGKTHEDIHKEWHEPGEKRARIQLILGEIALKEKIEPNADELKKHVEHTVSQHKDISEDRARAYFEHLLRNEAVLRWLETR
jgi:FKBP-type peptidyl-prolyl cis-trans isomerase (trigger factor)